MYYCAIAFALFLPIYWSILLPISSFSSSVIVSLSYVYGKEKALISTVAQ